MENRRQLQCKALRGREKSHRRRNNGNNGKNNAQNNGNSRNSRAESTSDCDAGRQATVLRAEWPSGGPSLLAEFAEEPGRNSHTPIHAISTNRERAQQRNHNEITSQPN
jgi:hypothetical protein